MPRQPQAPHANPIVWLRSASLPYVPRFCAYQLSLFLRSGTSPLSRGGVRTPAAVGPGVGRRGPVWRCRRDGAPRRRISACPVRSGCCCRGDSLPVGSWNPGERDSHRRASRRASCSLCGSWSCFRNSGPLDDTATSPLGGGAQDLRTENNKVFEETKSRTEQRFTIMNNQV